MGNPITNNLPAKLDQFLMDMAQTVGPFNYSDIMHFADRISDVKKDKNIAVLRKLYVAAKDAAEYDDDEELSIIGEDINDIITGVKDFNQPGAIFADTRTFKYEDSQNSEYNDLGTDTRTEEKFPEPGEGSDNWNGHLHESEADLTDMQKDLIKEIALADFECGHFTDVSFFIDDEEDDFTGLEQAAADYYTELINMGPAGFYEEFRDELDFDPDFVAEYGDPEDDDDLDESTKKSDLKEDLDLDSLVGKKVKCIKGASHPNMGKLFTKGKTYTVGKAEDGRFTVGKVYVGEDFFKNHFEVENALDENYDDIYSATFKAKGFVNQMRKTYDDATIIQAVKACLKESKKQER